MHHSRKGFLSVFFAFWNQNRLAPLPLVKTLKVVGEFLSSEYYQMRAKADRVDCIAFPTCSLRIHLFFVFKQNAIIPNIHKGELPTYTGTLCEHCFDPV